jgi:hypothetical protein
MLPIVRHNSYVILKIAQPVYLFLAEEQYSQAIRIFAMIRTTSIVSATFQSRIQKPRFSAPFRNPPSGFYCTESGSPKNQERVTCKDKSLVGLPLGYVPTGGDLLLATASGVLGQVACIHTQFTK